jgi:hypothetical protein
MIWKRARYLCYALLACLAVFGLAAAEHHGQVKYGGLPVPGATVTATQGDKKQVAVTDSQGVYSFPDLADGVWTIQVEMLCFETLKQDVGIAPEAPSPSWELKLLPLDRIMAVAATAPPPAAPAVTGLSVATTAAVTDDKNRSSVPPTTAPTPTAAAAKGKANDKKSSPTSPANSQAGFQRTDLNASADAAPPDATLPAAAADPNANASDAFVLNGSVSNRIESRAIGNARRGVRSMYNANLSFIMDNSALNARPFSLTGQDTPKQAYNHFQIGGSVGGPLYIPHVLRSNGQFFFGYQTIRNRNASTMSGLMPTEAEQNGDFSKAVNALGQPVMFVDPKTGMLGNTLDPSEISPQAKALLSLYPAPGFAQSAGYNYQIPIIGTNVVDQLQARVNRNLNSKNFVNGSFGYQRSNTRQPNLFRFVDTTQMAGLVANAQYRHIFTNRFNGTLTYNYSRSATRLTPNFANVENVAGDAKITGDDQTPSNWGPPALNFQSSGISGLSDAQESFTRNQTSWLGYSGLWMPRPHNITFVVDYRRQQFNYLSQPDARGTFGFTGAATAQIVNGVPVPGTGSDFADFLLGIPDTSSISFALNNAGDRYLRANLWDAGFTDDWRIGPTLTLNAGMRWEYSSPISELQGRLVNLDIAPGFVAEKPVLGGNPVGPLTGLQYPGSLVRPDKHGFLPRVAFAWHPLAGSSMVVRGGYGIYLNTSVYQSIASQMMQQSPLSKTLMVANSPADPLTLANGFNASPASTPNTFAIDPNFLVGYSQNWQVSVQKDLTDSTVATVTYLGIKGTRGMQEFLPNTYPTGAVNPCPTCPSGYTYMTSNGNSTRESGSLQLRRRMHNGFATSAQYTFSRSFDDAVLGGGGGAGVIAQNWLNLSAERGPSNFDQRHLVSATAQYTSGMGLGGGTLMSGWLGALVKGWTFVATPSFGTGLPETPIYSQVIAGTGFTGIRPDSVAGISVYSPAAGRNLNPAAYEAPPPGQWGDAGRNSITGPSQFSLNASMGRSFNTKGFINLIDLRFDATNALNHVTFPSWNTTITSAQFGYPNPANAMRVMKVNLRLRF